MLISLFQPFKSSIQRLEVLGPCGPLLLAPVGRQHSQGLFGPKQSSRFHVQIFAPATIFTQKCTIPPSSLSFNRYILYQPLLIMISITFSLQPEVTIFIIQFHTKKIQLSFGIMQIVYEICPRGHRKRLTDWTQLITQL